VKVTGKKWLCKAICLPHTFKSIVNIMEWLPECRKTVNAFVNTSILDAQTFNIIVSPADIDNNIEGVRPAIVKSLVLMLNLML